MRDKVLAYAIIASIAAHLIILFVIGKTANARPASVPTEIETKLVQVEVVKSPYTPQPVAEPVVEQEPEPTPKKEIIHKPEKHIPQPPRQETVQRQQPNQSRTPPPAPTPRPQPAPNQERNTNLGTTSNRGEELGGSGRNPIGQIPNNQDNSRQTTRTPQPVPAPPAPGPTPTPPPPPPDVNVRVCVKTGLLPNQNCESTTTRSFRQGHEPTARCSSCQPKHVSTLADRAKPEMESGKRRPDYPITARSRGIEGSVTLEYTINTEGRVVDVKIISSSGNRDLDKAATDTVTSRKYKPAVQGGIPRNYRQRETFHFHLN